MLFWQTIMKLFFNKRFSKEDYLNWMVVNNKNILKDNFRMTKDIKRIMKFALLRGDVDLNIICRLLRKNLKML